MVATSSLVSKSAEEKEEEKIKTKSLSDEDPLIEEFKDQNESEQEQQENKDESEDGFKSSGEQQDVDQSETSGSESSGVDTPPSQEITRAEQKDQNQPESNSEEGKSDLDVIPSQASEGGAPVKGDIDSSNGQGTGKEKVEGVNSEEGEQVRGEEAKDSNGESGHGVTENGTSNADYDHASGTAYGTRNEAMTKQELEKTARIRDDLKDLKNKLSAMTRT